MAGSLLIVAAPSGAGKTSLVRALLAARPRVRLSVSFTTRPPRPGELDGRDYCFVSRERFEELNAQGKLLEWATVHGNLYGTSREWIESQMAQGNDIVLELLRVFEGILCPRIVLVRIRQWRSAQGWTTVRVRGIHHQVGGWQLEIFLST